jgi:putative tributyrin esterase
VNFALKYPGTFAFDGSISGAFNAQEMALIDSRADLAHSLQSAFGAAESRTLSDIYFYSYIEHAFIASTPYLYIDCGNRDVTFLEPNRKLTAKLSQRELEYEYHETPGAHTWRYWDSRLPELLDAVARKIAPNQIQ